ncbi:MAG: rRNA maturation RNase YbeY [Acidobacteria bacterium]|nr:rRNA maturation RNase YbeY [Acidobacteriota bacterium]MCB9398960.1 rRNA maturation RNase YbeY [Acidobacteriota bacterium]
MDPDSSSWEVVWDPDGEEPPPLALDDFCAALQQKLGLKDSELCVLLCDDQRIQALNAQFRHKNKVTDVLSFPQKEAGPYLGDIAISLPQAQRQAQEIGQSLEEEVRFLILHGVLHLLGYDHETDQGQMLQKQSELKMELGTFFPGSLH